MAWIRIGPQLGQCKFRVVPLLFFWAESFLGGLFLYLRGAVSLVGLSSLLVCGAFAAGGREGVKDGSLSRLELGLDFPGAGWWVAYR